MIIQHPLSSHFTVLNNDMLNDARLSMEAIGVLSWLSSKPRNWIVNLEHIRKHFRCGRQKIQRIMAEIIAAGWVRRRPIRADGRGTFASGDYLVFNVRQAAEDAEEGRAEPQVENTPTVPRATEPEASEPQARNPPAYKERTLPRTDSSEPIGSGSGKPAPDRKLVFSEGRLSLVALGLDRRTAGDVIGKWLRESDDPGRVLAAIRSAHEHGATSPIPWINAHLQPRQNHVRTAGRSDLDQALDDAAEWLRALEQPHAGDPGYGARQPA